MTSSTASILFIQEIDPMTLLDLQNKYAVKFHVTENLADCKPQHWYLTMWGNCLYENTPLGQEQYQSTHIQSHTYLYAKKWSL